MNSYLLYFNIMLRFMQTINIIYNQPTCQIRSNKFYMSCFLKSEQQFETADRLIEMCWSADWNWAVSWSPNGSVKFGIPRYCYNNKLAKKPIFKVRN